MKLRNTIIFYLIPISIGFASCKKIVDVDVPIDQIVGEKVFLDDKIATTTVTGIYSQLVSNKNFFSSFTLSLYPGLSSDELTNTTGDAGIDEFTSNAVTPANTYILSNFWTYPYKYIFQANSCIEGLNASTTLTDSVRNQLLGEVKFIRAFCFFYLVNLYGDVPLILTTDYRINQSMSRTSASLVYQQIERDLIEAQSLLKATYPSAGKVRPNRYTASALLSRVYLYMKDWLKAESTANEVITSGVYSLSANVSQVFLSTSSETIWQLLTDGSNANTYEGSRFIPGNSTSLPPSPLTSSFMNSFEAGDNRKSNWTSSNTVGSQTYYYPYKYKQRTNSPVTECPVYLRLGEQYLIRAEARAQQNNISGSQSDLNTIRNRAGLGSTSANTTATLLSAIEQERRVEFFAEWGHRWFDLKRNNRSDAVLGPIKGSGWQPTDVLYPIPQREIINNSNLTQNPGY